MRLNLLFVTAVCWCLFAPTRAAFAAGPNDPCSVPQDLQREISSKYSGSKLITISDLYDNDRKLFQKEHGDECPGLVSVDFYGDKKQTVALVLTSGEGLNQKAELVLAHRVGAGWETTVLDTAGSSIPVVWRQKPGTYKDIENGKIIRATRPVIVFCGYYSWAIVYAWTGKGVEKVWLAD